MIKTIQKYGLYGGALICVLFLLSWFAGDGLDFTTQEIIGYASMVVALSMVYFGIRHFRDRVNSGTLSFGTGFRIGLGITLITALIFGILDVIYVKWLNPEFMDTYYDTLAADLKNSLPAAEFQERLQQMEAEKELFSNPLLSFLLMALTVFMIGLIISVISALVLKRKPATAIH